MSRANQINNQRSPFYVNPYAEQNNKIPGHRFITDRVPNVGLPGIPSTEGKVYVPLDMIRTRGPYASDDDGWIKVVNKRARRYRRNGGWVGSETSN